MCRPSRATPTSVPGSSKVTSQTSPWKRTRDLGLLLVGRGGDEDGAAVEGEVGVEALGRGVQDDRTFEERADELVGAAPQGQVDAAVEAQVALEAGEADDGVLRRETALVLERSHDSAGASAARLTRTLGTPRW